MMKKILVFMFILGLVSSANATVVNLYLVSGGNATITAAVDDVITVELRGSLTLAMINKLDITHDSAATLALGTFSTKGGGNGESVGTIVGGDIIDMIASSGSGLKFITGTDYVYTFQATVTGDGTIGLVMQTSDRVTNSTTTYYPAPTGTQNSVTLSGLTIIPEPMTLVLLGLGGLFLRRRK